LPDSLRISIPDDAPPVLRPSAVWPELVERAQVAYWDTLPGSEEALIERIGSSEAVLNIRSSCKFTDRVFAALPELRIGSAGIARHSQQPAGDGPAGHREVAQLR
jgi:hypothetical protein